ncbi:MAG: hypothetical protein SGBAC_009936 [Bacillariaceae sp.]
MKISHLLTATLLPTLADGRVFGHPTSFSIQTNRPARNNLDLNDSFSAVTNNIPRGGGPTIDPVLAARIFTFAYGLNGLSGALAPVKHIKMYMVEQVPSKAGVNRIASLTSVGATTGLLFYLQLAKGMSFEKAFGYSMIPMLFNFFYKLSSGEYKKEPLIPAILTFGTMQAGITQSSYAPLVIKAHALIMLVNGLLCFLAPVWSAKEGILWAPKLDPGRETFFWVLSGVYQLTQAVATGLPAFRGMDIVSTIGWAIAVVASLLAYIASTDLMPRATVPKPPLFAWISLCIYLATSILA